MTDPAPAPDRAESVPTSVASSSANATPDSGVKSAGKTFLTKARRTTATVAADVKVKAAQAPGQVKAAVAALPGQTRKATAETKRMAAAATEQTRRAAVQGKAAYLKQVDKAPLPESIKTKLKPKKREDVEVPDMSGKVVLVTGGNTGIGLEVAKRLFKSGAHVIIVGRSEARCLEAVGELHALATSIREGQQEGPEEFAEMQEIDQETEEMPEISTNAEAKRAAEEQEGEASDQERPNWGAVEYMLCDMSQFSSIEEFVADYKATGLPLHVLVNNAGVYLPPNGTTQAGFELQMGVNHVSTFYLTNLLMDTLKASAPSRVVIVSSQHAADGKLMGDELMTNTGRKCNLQSYCTSKLFECMYANELRMRVAPYDVDVLVCQPGFAKTPLQDKAAKKKLRERMGGVSRKAQPCDLAALSAVLAASHPDAKGEFGMWYGPNKKNNKNTELRPINNRLAQDPAWCKRLYEDTAAAIHRALTAPPPLPQDVASVASASSVAQSVKSRKSLPPARKTKKTGSAKLAAAGGAVLRSPSLQSSASLKIKSGSPTKADSEVDPEDFTIKPAMTMKQAASIKRRASIKESEAAAAAAAAEAGTPVAARTSSGKQVMPAEMDSFTLSSHQIGSVPSRQASLSATAPITPDKAA